MANNQWEILRVDSNWDQPLCLIESTKDEPLKINQKTLSLLQQVTEPVIVVSVVGLYRTGKSYLMNRLAGSQGFDLGSTVQSKTKGIWIWVVSHPNRCNCSLVLLDTEGLGDAEKGNAEHDTSIFALAVLLSSTLIYNSMGVINQYSIDQLHFVTEMSENIKIKSNGNDDESVDFDKFFPSFIWAVRDFILDPIIDGKLVTADEYLDHVLKIKNGAGRKVAEYNLPRECIRMYFPQRKCFTFPRPVEDPNLMKNLESADDSQLNREFVHQAKQLLHYVFDSAQVKSVNGKDINGSVLGGLATCYVEAIRNGAVPCIQSAVESTAKIENERAITESIELYEMKFRNTVKFPTDTMLELSNCHHDCEREAAEHFKKLAIFDSEEIYYRRLMEQLTLTYENLARENEKVSQETCQSLIQSLHKPIEDDFEAGKFVCPGGYEAYTRSMNSLEQNYRESPKKGVMSEAVLRDFMKRQESASTAVLKADKKLTEEVKKVEEERQRVEAMKREKRAAEEELSKKVLLMESQEKSHKEHVRRLKSQAEDDRRKMIENSEKVLQKRLNEQKQMLKEDFKERADAMSTDIANLRKSIEEQKGTELLDFLGNFIPVIPGVIKALTRQK